MPRSSSQNFSSNWRRSFSPCARSSVARSGISSASARSAAPQRAAYAYAWISDGAIGPSASVPSAWKIESCESFHPWWIEPARGAALVFQEAVAVGVAGTVHPPQRALDVGPDAAREGQVTGLAVVVGGKADEERRGVVAAVVAAERDLTGAGHLAAPHLVQDLARLGVVGGILPVGLLGRQVREDALGQVGIHPQRLAPDDQRVAPEHRREPRNAGVRVGPVLGLGRHHHEVGHRAAEPLVAQLVGAPEPRPGRVSIAAQIPRAPQGGLEADRPRPTPLVVAADGDVQARRPSRLEPQLVDGARAVQLAGDRVEADPGPTLHVVQALVLERHAIRLDLRRQAGAALPAPHAAHLEDVGEVGTERHHQLKSRGAQAEVADRDALVAGAVPQHLGPRDVHGAVAQRLAAQDHVGVGEVDREPRVVAFRSGPEQQRPLLADAQHQARQVAGALVVDPLLGEADGLDVAVAVEQRERVLVLEDLVLVIGQRGACQNIEPVPDLDDVRHSPQLRQPGVAAPIGWCGVGHGPWLSTGCGMFVESGTSAAPTANARGEFAPSPMSRW